MMEMKLQAAETTDTLRDIYNRVLQNPNTDTYVRESLGYTDIEYQMRYIRRSKYPPVPKDMLEMIDALSGEHPFQDLFHGFVTFDDDKIAFLFGDRDLLNIVKGIFLGFRVIIYYYAFTIIPLLITGQSFISRLQGAVHGCYLQGEASS
jgi:hypothetical protein